MGVHVVKREIYSELLTESEQLALRDQLFLYNRPFDIDIVKPLYQVTLCAVCYRHDHIGIIASNMPVLCELPP